MAIPFSVHVRDEEEARAARYRATPPPPSSSSSTSTGGDGGGRGCRLVLFSHGLTGTGEENSIFCASLARRGYVVASIHHRDGSSCRAPSHVVGGDCTYYAHVPAGDDYDPRYRLRQVHVRAGEFLKVRSWLVGGGGGGDSAHDGDDDDDAGRHRRIVLDQIRPHLANDGCGGTIAAGFSYGATTAALAATLEPDKFRCAVLLDPWLHVDYSSRGVEFDFPPEAFGKGWPDDDDDDEEEEGADAGRMDGKVGLRTPSVFISSSQFRGYEKLYGATRRLADRINSHVDDDDDEKNDENDALRGGSSRRDRNRAEMHVIPDTVHSNFCDVVFWLPRRMARKVFRLGDADAYDAHEEILDKTVRFLRRF
ncbi:hypothetical protein ACHAW5_009940 [Stephanodiscus triporus]|uniref:1-alkyl-2-acetylglycerophosphocholine esterase n=1 Tax=Stephanodiscus triporus TaxID=2934178 RepID=A0ABD3Q4S0_9STRA